MDKIKALLKLLERPEVQSIIGLLVTPVVDLIRDWFKNRREAKECKKCEAGE